MSLGTASQRTMVASTSYQTSVSCHSVPCRSYSGRARRSALCNSYSRQQNCSPNNGFPRGFGNFGPMMFGDNGMAAAQVAELMQKFAKAMNASNEPNNRDRPQSTGFLAVDLIEQDSNYLLVADVPGLEKSDLKISVNQTDQTLKIAGERKRGQSTDSADASGSGFRTRYERGMGKFQRVLSKVPKDADLSAVSARVDKGVLTITVQKLDLARDEEDIRIDVN